VGELIDLGVLERLNAMRNEVMGYATLADQAHNKSQRLRYQRQAQKAYRKLEAFVKANPPTLTPGGEGVRTPGAPALPARTRAATF
jgi:hypothetical protein